MYKQAMQDLASNGYSLVPYSEELRSQLCLGLVFWVEDRWIKLSRKEHTSYSQQWQAAETKRNLERNKSVGFARKVVFKAIDFGELIPEPCLKCGDPEVQGHHWDYSKPLDVIWYCRSCHSQLHVNWRLGNLNGTRVPNPFRLTP